jgi:hypothetical protein
LDLLPTAQAASADLHLLQSLRASFSIRFAFQRPWADSLIGLRSGVQQKLLGEVQQQQQTEPLVPAEIWNPMSFSHR